MIGLTWLNKIARSLLHFGGSGAQNAAEGNGQAEVLPALEGDFSPENYPSDAIAACLEAYQRALAHLPENQTRRNLAQKLEEILGEHQNLIEDLADFNGRAGQLRGEILALTAAAKPLQLPGIGMQDAQAMREALSQKAAVLQQKRDAYEEEEQSMQARIQQMLSGIAALRASVIALAGAW